MQFKDNNRDLTINFLKKGNCFYVVYDKNMVQYEDINREHKLQKKEKRSRGTTCKICNNLIIEKDNKYDCEGCSTSFHKSCLKDYFVNLRAANSLSDGKAFECPSCKNPIKLKLIMTEEEYGTYIAGRKTRKAKRSEHPNKYPKPRPSISYPPISRGERSGSFKEEKHHCVLCGESFELNNVIESVFYHHAHNNNCKGGYVHKKCLRKVLSIYFWRKYERYNGISILILTENEAQVLGKSWVCPLCNEKLTERDLKMLVDPREWIRQEKMRDERDRVFKSRYNDNGIPIIVSYIDSKGFI